MQQFDKQQVAESFSRSATTYSAAAIMQKEVGQRMLDRLDYIRIQPVSILDLGCGPGEFSRALAKRYNKAQVVSLDLAPGMLNAAKSQKRWRQKQSFVCADAEALPFATNSFDFIFSNMVIHWANDINKIIHEIHRVLKPGGMLLFSTLGQDTLYELRNSWQHVDAQTHVHNFIDMHNLGDALLHANLVNPVVDVEMLTLTYPDVFAVMRDLKAIGGHNLDVERHKGLTGKSRLQQLKRAYEHYRTKAGVLPLSYEVIYGHAWGNAEKQRSSTQQPSEFAVSLEQLKKTLK